jgi:hypothetical protein
MLSPPVESGSGVTFGIKLFQPPLNRSCGGSNRSPPYQVRRQSSLNQLTMSNLIPLCSIITKAYMDLDFLL